MVKEITKNISYILQFIGSAKFMAGSLWNLDNNLSEEIDRIKCKFEHDNKKCKTPRIKYKYCDCFCEYTNFEDHLIEYKCFCCNKSYQRKFDEKLSQRFLVYTNFLAMKTISLFYCSKEVFILINMWMIGKNSMKHQSVPAKEAFYSHLSLGDITDADYAHSKRVCKDFVKKIRRTSRFVCLKWYIIVSWCIWKL